VPRPLACAGRPKLARMAGTDHPSVEATKGVLDAEPAERMRALAGLRNRLVHVYEEVDDGIVSRVTERRPERPQQLLACNSGARRGVKTLRR